MLNGVLLSGKKFAGKDHVYEHIKDVVLDRTVLKFAWATAVRLEVLDLLDCMGIKATMEELEDQRTKSKYVRLLQVWGTDIRREENPDYWVKKGLELVRGMSIQAQIEGKPRPFFVNTDSRFPNEIAARKYGFIAVRLTVSPEKQYQRARKLGIPFTEDMRLHRSETMLDQLERGFDPNVLAVPNEQPAFDYLVDSDRELPEVYADIDQILVNHGLSVRSV